MQRTDKYKFYENVFSILLIIIMIIMNVLKDFGFIDVAFILIPLSIIFMTYSIFALIKFKTKRDIVNVLLSILFLILSFLKLLY